MGGYSRALQLAYVSPLQPMAPSRSLGPPSGTGVKAYDGYLSPEAWFTKSVRNLKSVQSQSLIRPHKLRVRSESGQINSGERSILATLDVRFELPRSLPSSFDARLGQPADDTSDQMAHHVLPFYDRPTPRVEATQVLVPIAINTK